MPATVERSNVLTTGDVAEALCCREWCIRRALERGLISHRGRVGPYRTFSRKDLPAIRAVLLAAGYIDGPGGG